FDSLSGRYGADGGQLAKMYVVAHEYGHHIQHLSGTMQEMDRPQTGPQTGTVRLELQADCYAGVWAHHAANTVDDAGNAMLSPLTEEDIESALSAANAVGDDHIQGEAAGGEVRPEAWTRGSSAQRRAWLTTGYEQWTVAASGARSRAGGRARGPGPTAAPGGAAPGSAPAGSGARCPPAPPARPARSDAVDKF